MAAEKKTVIVIKKITIAGGGAHGGSWKVAFADFMTAMMAFFLVMWLLNQTPEQKKAIARYFSGPSVIEQQLSTYGAELTLEKLFMDLLNEPLKPFQTLLAPADQTPDLFALGTKNIVLHQVVTELGNVAKNIEINDEEIKFDIPDHILFEKGSEKPTGQFISVMENVKDLTQGLEFSHVNIYSYLHLEAVGGSPARAEDIASRRGDILKSHVENSLEHDSTDVQATPSVPRNPAGPGKPQGLIRFVIRQKELLPEKLQTRKLRGSQIGKKAAADTNVYDNFVKRMSEANRRKGKDQDKQKSE